MKQWLLRIIKNIIPRTNVIKRNTIKHETNVLVLMERYGCIYDDTLKGKVNDKS